jgi:hypothetical protein
MLADGGARSQIQTLSVLKTVLQKRRTNGTLTADQTKLLNVLEKNDLKELKSCVRRPA